MGNSCNSQRLNISNQLFQVSIFFFSKLVFSVVNLGLLVELRWLNWSFKLLNIWSSSVLYSYCGIQPSCSAIEARNLLQVSGVKLLTGFAIFQVIKSWLDPRFKSKLTENTPRHVRVLITFGSLEENWTIRHVQLHLLSLSQALLLPAVFIGHHLLSKALLLSSSVAKTSTTSFPVSMSSEEW